MACKTYVVRCFVLLVLAMQPLDASRAADDTIRYEKAGAERAGAGVTGAEDEAAGGASAGAKRVVAAVTGAEDEGVQKKIGSEGRVAAAAAADAAGDSTAGHAHLLASNESKAKRNAWSWWDKLAGTAVDFVEKELPEEEKDECEQMADKFGAKTKGIAHDLGSFFTLVNPAHAIQLSKDVTALLEDVDKATKLECEWASVEGIGDTMKRMKSLVDCLGHHFMQAVGTLFGMSSGCTQEKAQVDAEHLETKVKEVRVRELKRLEKKAKEAKDPKVADALEKIEKKAEKDEEEEEKEEKTLEEKLEKDEKAEKATREEKEETATEE